jgi:pimeloyl-ACP methyl ester carboxylesterase
MASAAGTVVPTAGPPTSRAGRRLRWLIACLVAVVLLLVSVAVGVAWYFSGVALAVDHSVVYPQTVQAPGVHPAVRSAEGSAGGRLAVRLTRDAETAGAGTVGLAWAGGYGRLGPVLSADATTVTREFTPVSKGTPEVGTRVRVDANTYSGDPSSALGLPFSEVRLPGPLGPLPAWLVPAGRSSVAGSGGGSGTSGGPGSGGGSGTSGGPGSGGGSGTSEGLTWVVFVHGHGGDRQESLRYLRTWHDLGIPVLVPGYRNDLGAPPSPDGWHHLGDTEWQDVAVAVRWARDHGAAGVVLAGWSMGGAIALQTVDRSDVAGLVRGLLLDSPVLDWRDVFDAQGAQRGLPGPEITLAERVLQWRSGISLDRLDWVARSKELRVPALIFHSDSDDYVPDGPALRLAEARPDLVTLVRFPGARHTMDWNVDPKRYDATMRDWFTRLPS